MPTTPTNVLLAALAVAVFNLAWIAAVVALVVYVAKAVWGA